MNGCSFYKEELSLLESLLPEELDVASPREHLNAIQILFQRTRDAVEAFNKKSFSAFDAIVGDQACQIRALQVCLLAAEDLSSEMAVIQEKCLSKLEIITKLKSEFSSREKKTLFKINKIREEKITPLSGENREIAKERALALEGIKRPDPRYKPINEKFAQKFAAVAQKKVSFEKEIQGLEKSCALKQHRSIREADLDFILSEKGLFLVNAFLLTLTKEAKVEKDNSNRGYEFHEYTNPKMLGIAGISFPTQIMNKVVDIAKKALVKQSVLFIQYQASLLKSSDAPLLQKMVSQPRFIAKKNHQELPFFYMTRVIFQRAMEEGVPIFLRVRNVAAHPLEPESFQSQLLFKVDEASGKYKAIPSDPSSTAIIIEAYSSMGQDELSNPLFQKKLLSNAGELLRFIDYNTSQHSQFTDQKITSAEMFDILDIENEKKERLVQMMLAAIKKGFSLSNPALCCIDHICCDQVGNQIQAEEK
ncbi:MAG: hypothetical protein ACE5GN_02800 [Waddliaceae bacterium]